MTGESVGLTVFRPFELRLSRFRLYSGGAYVLRDQSHTT
jgi:hypothetical protein